MRPNSLQLVGCFTVALGILAAIYMILRPDSVSHIDPGPYIFLAIIAFNVDRRLRVANPSKHASSAQDGPA